MLLLSVLFSLKRSMLEELLSAHLTGLGLPLMPLTRTETKNNKGKNERKEFHRRK